MLPLALWMQAVTLTASPFWTQLDASCREVTKLAEADTSSTPDLDSDREAVVSYCKYTLAPAFAARPDPERRKRLEAVLVRVGVPMPATPPPVPVHAVSNFLVAAAKEKLDREPPPQLGLMGEKILGTALGGLCSEAEVKPVLRATCALTEKSTVSLAALRLAVIQDLVTAIVQYAADQLPTSLRLVALALTTEDLRSIDLGLPFGGGPSALARSLAERLLADGALLDKDKEHYRRVVIEVVREQLRKDASFTLSPAASAATDACVDALRELDEERQRAAHVSSTIVAEKLLVALRKTFVLAAVLAGDADPSAQASANAYVAALGPATDSALNVLGYVVRADAKGAVDAATRELGTTIKLSPAAVRGLRAAAALSEARDEADLKRAARDAVLPLPPWVDRVAFDLNLAPPVNKRVGGDSELSLNGDIMLGYNGDRFGIVGSASSAYYDIQAGGNSALTERYAGSLDGWVLFPVGKSVRIEPRISAGGSYYGTLSSDQIEVGNRQTNQDSIFLRGVGSLGVRVQGSRVAGSASFGLGGQYEDYFRVLQTAAGDQGTTFNYATTLRYEARARVQVVLWPQVLVFRARGDLQAFDMRRADQAITYTIGRVTQNEQGVTEISQLELFARGFLDAEIARFFGFVPSVHGGANVFSFSSNGVGATTVVPVIGLGIRREAL